MVTIAVAGESHGLRNEADEDLVFIDLIAQNHALENSAKQAGKQKNLFM